MKSASVMQHAIGGFIVFNGIEHLVIWPSCHRSLSFFTITFIPKRIIGSVLCAFDMAKTYLIESKHTNEDCLKALDEIVAHNRQLLDKCWMGCSTGNHTGWAAVEAQDESEARNMLPTNLRQNASVTEVSKFTPEQIQSFHGMK